MHRPKLKLGEEYVPPDEGEGIREVVSIGKAELEQIARRSQIPIPREQHPKQFGCVWAEFIVEDNLPNYLQEGVFQEGTTYKAWIRFSSRKEQYDPKGDLSYGMAIKLMDIGNKEFLEDEGRHAKTQDFLMVNHPVFPIRDVKDYIISRNEKHEILKPLRLAFRLRPFRLSGREVAIVLGMGKNIISKIKNPLELRYWSMVPYRLGLEPICQPWSTTPHEPCLRAIKFFVKPHLPHNRSMVKVSKSENFLREALSTFLSQKDAYFDFYVQLQTDPERMPIEDPRIEWRGAQEHKVATIRIPAQVFNVPDHQEFGEHLSFTPWHCLPAHQPLGGINRVRRAAYEAGSIVRHQFNQSQRQEPTCKSSAKFRKLIDLPQPQQALTVLIPLKPDVGQMVPSESSGGQSTSNFGCYLCSIAEQIQAKLRQNSPSTHFARWVIVGDASSNEDLKSHLLFTSNYDGEFKAYIQELLKAIGSNLDEIFTYCEGYIPKTTDDLQKTIEFIKRHQFSEQVFGVAHPDKTVAMIQKGRWVRQLLDELLDYQGVQTTLKAFQELLLQRSSLIKQCECKTIAEVAPAFWDDLLVPILERLVGIRQGYRKPDKKLEWNEERKQRLRATEGRIAQNEMTVLVAIKSGRYEWLLRSLVLPLTQRRIDQRRSTIMKLETIHFARWVLLNKQRLCNARFSYLLFESNYNGNWDSYISDFINMAGERLNCIWGNCIEYPLGGSQDENWFKQHIRKYQFPAQIFYSAYDDLTVKDIEVNDQISTVALDFLSQKGVQNFVAGNYKPLS
jgi:hypothetical protein